MQNDADPTRDESNRPTQRIYITRRTDSNPRSSYKKSTHPTSSSLLCSILHLALPASLYRADGERLGEWTFCNTFGGCCPFYEWYIFFGLNCMDLLGRVPMHSRLFTVSTVFIIYVAELSAEKCTYSRKTWSIFAENAEHFCRVCIGYPLFLALFYRTILEEILQYFYLATDSSWFSPALLYWSPEQIEFFCHKIS